MDSSDEGRRTSSSSPYAIVGADIVLPDIVLARHVVIVADGQIEAVLPESQCPPGLRRLDLAGGLLAPGLIDLHVHGTAGVSFNDADPEGAATAGQALLRAGVTTMLPTLASAPIPQLLECLDALAVARSAPSMPRMAGAHLEGPYFASAQRGAQAESALRRPDDETADALLERHREIRMMSLAPELPGAIRLIERLVANRIVAAAGHTDGTEDDLIRARDAGLSHVIHVYSGQSTTRRNGPWRVPGILEATLASDDLTVEMIADGKHLPASLMRIAHRALSGRLCLVSDATPGAGLADGSRYRMGAGEYIVERGVGVTPDRTSFGGSTTLLPAMLPIAHRTLGLSVPEAVAMVTSIPAHAARLTDVGEITAGKHADFVHLDDQLQVLAVARGGIWIPNHP